MSTIPRRKANSNSFNGDIVIQPIEITAVSREGSPNPVANLSSNTNYVLGTGNIVHNHNHNTNYVLNAGIHMDSDTIQAKISTALRLRHVPDAVYDAQLGPGCLLGTRLEVLSGINTWIKDPKAPQIFWLTGHAGSGKSAIGHTVCMQACNDPDIILGGSFFCSRSAGSVAQRDVRCIVPTLAQLLARQSPAFSIALAAELARDPDLMHKQIRVQFEILLQRPLLALKDSPIPILFVVDALDECGAHKSANGTLDDPESHLFVTAILEALVGFSRSALKLPVKFLVTSRPETHIRDTPVSDPTFSKILQLHTVDKDQVTGDIRLYISTRLLSTTGLRGRFTTDHIELLVRLCGGSFIVATIALHYILDAGRDHASIKLQTLLNVTRDGLSNGASAPLDRMYALIISDATKADTLKAQMPRMLASLLATRMTLSVSALAELLEVPDDHLRASLSHLHAVVHVPENDIEPGLRTLHASFGDYLLERADKRYRIDLSLGNAALFNGCLKVMSKQLHFNISQSRSSYAYNERCRPNNITLALEYACLHWIYHDSRLPLSSSVNQRRGLRQQLMSMIHRASNSKPEDMIGAIFRSRFLFWLEVMSVLGQVRRASAMLNFALEKVRSTDLSQFFRDANAFVASSQEAIALSAPHIYLSALPFAAKESLVYQDFVPHCIGLVDISLQSIENHAGKLVMSLTDHEDSVHTVAYSSDGRLLASGSRDGTVRIWDTRTSEEYMPPLRSGDGSVWSVAIAPNGVTVASGTEAGVVCVWQLLGGPSSPLRLSGHSGAVPSVDYSFNSFYLASGSEDCDARIWNPETGQCLAVLTGHAKRVGVVVFYPNSAMLVSGSHDKTIRLWRGLQSFSIAKYDDAISSIGFAPDGRRFVAACGGCVIVCDFTTGKAISMLKSGRIPVRSVAFSPDGQFVVAAIYMSAYILTVPRYGHSVLTTSLNGHTDYIRRATISPNGLYIASAGADSRISIWNTKSGKWTAELMPVEERDNSSTCVGLSYHGARMIGSCHDYSVHVWDVRSQRRIVRPLVGHTDKVRAAAASPDGRLIASHSMDWTVRLWDARTGTPIGNPMRFDAVKHHSLSFSPDALLLALSGGRCVYIWDVRKQLSLDFSPLSCEEGCFDVSFSPDGKLLASGSEGIDLWRVETGEHVGRMSLKWSRYMGCFAFSPDSTRIALGADDGAIEIWHIGDEVRLLCHDSSLPAVSSIAYSHDGLFIGNGSTDGSIYIRDVATGVLIAKLKMPTCRAVPHLAFTPNGESIVSGSDNGIFRVWGVKSLLNRSESDFNTASILNSATFENGWLIGSSGELLLWVPAPYREQIMIAPCVRLINSGGMVSINIGRSGWKSGSSWDLCWRE